MKEYPCTCKEAERRVIRDLYGVNSCKTVCAAYKAWRSKLDARNDVIRTEKSKIQESVSYVRDALAMHRSNRVQKNEKK